MMHRERDLDIHSRWGGGKSFVGTENVFYVNAAPDWLWLFRSQESKLGVGRRDLKTNTVSSISHTPMYVRPGYTSTCLQRHGIGPSRGLEWDRDQKGMEAGENHQHSFRATMKEYRNPPAGF